MRNDRELKYSGKRSAPDEARAGHAAQQAWCHEGPSARTKVEEVKQPGQCAHNLSIKECKQCRRRGICQHQREKRMCKECGGAGLCAHQRQRSRCKECSGKGLCDHQRIRSRCKECQGSGICQHQRERSKCKECGGTDICEHQRQRSRCKECGGKGLCLHQRIRSRCKECSHSTARTSTIRQTMVAAPELQKVSQDATHEPVLVPRRKKITKVHAEFLSSMNAQNSSFPPLW